MNHPYPKLDSPLVFGRGFFVQKQTPSKQKSIALSVQTSYNVRMKEERIEIRANEEFVEKVDYLKRINDYKSRADTIRKTVEKEYRKEKEDG